MRSEQFEKRLQKVRGQLLVHLQVCIVFMLKEYFLLNERNRAKSLPKNLKKRNQVGFQCKVCTDN